MTKRLPLLLFEAHFKHQDMLAADQKSPHAPNRRFSYPLRRLLVDAEWWKEQVEDIFCVRIAGISLAQSSAIKSDAPLAESGRTPEAGTHFVPATRQFVRQIDLHNNDDDEDDSLYDRNCGI